MNFATFKKIIGGPEKRWTWDFMDWRRVQHGLSLGQDINELVRKASNVLVEGRRLYRQWKDVRMSKKDYC